MRGGVGGAPSSSGGGAAPFAPCAMSDFCSPRRHADGVMATPARTAIVTGGSSGLGLAIAQALLADGWRVAVIARRAEAARDHVDGADHAARLVCVAADLSVAAECERAAAAALAALGGELDLLVNNAGGGVVGQSIESASPADLTAALAVNLTSGFCMTQACVAALAARRGAVVNMSSVAAQRPIRGMLPYCVSKAALDQLTRCSALELAPRGIRVNAVSPATVATGFHEAAGLSAEAAAAYHASSASGAVHPLGRVGTPADVAALVLFLAAPDKAGWMTGSVLVVDGGRLLTSALGTGLVPAASPAPAAAGAT
jgi:NAD(P)-dependent dehydrogenase (short-subunit alcohol dehydrogenase family)